MNAFGLQLTHEKKKYSFRTFVTWTGIKLMEKNIDSNRKNIKNLDVYAANWNFKKYSDRV